ncbi:ribonuclease P protein component [Luteolibacter algae]|uniref:Ribonuclease P protein component n=1 Tax=Luteolibacter algae TaxID=454151 RepID=A0ABW5D9N9_9BACT
MMRLPRKQSINQRADFNRIRKTGQAKAGRFVIISTLEDPELSCLRTAFVTSKRAAKRAHDRNLLRRRFRALIQKHAPGFPVQNRFVITIARPNSANASFEELEADWLRLCKRLKMLS